MKNILPVLFLLMMTQLLIGQVNKCGHQSLLENLSPQLNQLVDQTFEEAKQKINNGQSRSRQLLTVPVVVHILYNKPEQNISDELVHSQIDVLNEDFQRLNTDAGETRAIFQGVAGNPDIQFVLADTDPDGNPTTGITRTETDVRSFLPFNITLNDQRIAADSCGIDLSNIQEYLDGFICFNNTIRDQAFEKLIRQGAPLPDHMKFSATGGKDAWDQDRYINIWVGNLTSIFDTQPTTFLLGTGTPPVGAPNWEGIDLEIFKEVDGIIIHHEVFGRDKLLNNRGGGRVGTHEMGHYLGLRHIFGDGFCEEDDGLSDTPRADGLVPPKSLAELTTVLTCTKAKEKDTCLDDALPDMVENYMDYSPDGCQNMFTIEQAAIMRSILEGPRSGLILEQITNTYEQLVDQSIRLFPNPTNGQVYIDMKDIDPQDYSVHVENLIGQQLFEQSATSDLDLNKLNKGIYLVRFKSPTVNIAKKIILE